MMKADFHSEILVKCDFDGMAKQNAKKNIFEQKKKKMAKRDGLVKKQAHTHEISFQQTSRMEYYRLKRSTVYSFNQTDDIKMIANRLMWVMTKMKAKRGRRRKKKNNATK